VLLSVNVNEIDNGSQIPESEQIVPNQRSCQDSVLTAEHIGVPKRKRTTDDLYGASGKRTKLDGVLAGAHHDA
jgi:hypothetical protein